MATCIALAAGLETKKNLWIIIINIERRGRIFAKKKKNFFLWSQKQEFTEN
jgi:hypothetical protein